MQQTKIITATRIEPTPDKLIIHCGRKEAGIPWRKCSRRLASASVSQRLNAQLSPGGYGIHWPELDEDLSIAGLLRTGKAG